VNREKFIEKVKAEQNALRAFLLALCCGRQADADDLFQDAVLKAYIAFGNYTDRGKFRPWLFRIAYNAFLSRVISVQEHDHLEAADVLCADQRADGVYEHQELYLALAGLPPRERSSITLYYLNGYSIREIAEISECSEDAVRKQLSRGREKLRETIKR